ncbi:hypothetical protein H257_12996 [Aphanomyces astaci]|uniref:DDE-1 domain-containing protein n=1 Tax=Aphanomyces astaci TaxID=112090 RepID=W4FYV9_APHAT|nr:hypothetical protein H257_12996 [Aphanomyces astaci]ETV71863.1 hypothetical protein H257_12996 [Aphanomyces astaci]|eukprot:XP_009838712.1 hypothetical protein H257_12996 [Aphanomyces astaci]
MQSTLRIPKRNYNITIKQEFLRLIESTVDYKVAELMNIAEPSEPRFHRNGFSRQRPGKNKARQEALLEVRDDYATEFQSKIPWLQSDCIYNVDEPGFYSTCRRGDAKISTGEKLSLRMMVVLTVRSNGDKLPIFFVIRGTPGVRIDRAELQTCPSGHFYAVQAKAWMDNIVWKTYLRRLL